MIWCNFVGYTHLPLFSKVDTWNIKEYRSSATYINSPKLTLTSWKVSKCGFIPGPYFPVFPPNLCIQSEYREIGTRNNSVYWILFTQWPELTDMLWMIVTVITTFVTVANARKERRCKQKVVFLAVTWFTIC